MKTCCGASLAFGPFGSRVSSFDVIAITDMICFLPLAINDSEAMWIVIGAVIKT